MKSYSIKLILPAVFSLIPTIAFAQNGERNPPDSMFGFFFLIIVIVLTSMIYFMTISLTTMRRNRAYLVKAAIQMENLERHMNLERDHMEIMESRSKEIVELLKSIDRKLSEMGDSIA